MSEAERRTGYSPERVLIVAERILDPQFRALGITLDGAQVELLRNMMQYLNRKSTFVDEYADCYYLRVTDGDFDVISDIVASLEVKLMSDDNVMWGYNERLAWLVPDISDDAGTFYVSIGPVPSDEVWVIENAMVWHNLGTVCAVAFVLYADAVIHYLTPTLLPPTNAWYGGPTNVTVGPGDTFQAVFWGLDVGKTAQFSGAGYKMKVPE